MMQVVRPPSAQEEVVCMLLGYETWIAKAARWQRAAAESAGYARYWRDWMADQTEPSLRGHFARRATDWQHLAEEEAGNARHMLDVLHRTRQEYGGLPTWQS